MCASGQVKLWVRKQWILWVRLHQNGQQSVWFSHKTANQPSFLLQLFWVNPIITQLWFKVATLNSKIEIYLSHSCSKDGDWGRSGYLSSQNQKPPFNSLDKSSRAFQKKKQNKKKTTYSDRPTWISSGHSELSCNSLAPIRWKWPFTFWFLNNHTDYDWPLSSTDQNEWMSETWQVCFWGGHFKIYYWVQWT